ncbi:MAG TPA: hypothetical protein VG328_11380 [Stellaceae bacterium]|nr:hypothetical protein [Stellaceae bacterium]
MAETAKFRIGQSVELVAGPHRLSPLGRFEIVRLMPAEHGLRQYRIRSLTDGHERMVIEAELA